MEITYNGARDTTENTLVLVGKGKQLHIYKKEWNKKCYITGIVPPKAHSHWLIHGHMTSNNETVSRQKSLSGPH
jgi:hypothetical protein